jgi:hypothetical protein
VAFVLFAAIAVAGIAWGFSVGGTAFAAAVPDRAFASGEVVTVELDPAHADAVYIGYPSIRRGSGFSTSSRDPARAAAGICQAEPAGAVQFLVPEREVVVRANGTEWYQIALVQVPERGSYRLTCSREGARFGVAQDLSVGPAVVAFVVGGLSAFAIGILVLGVARSRKRVHPGPTSGS